MRRWMAAIMVLCLLALPLAAAEGLVLNTAEELTEYLNRCRAEGLAEMETICSGDLYAQISADDFAGLYRMAYLAGVSDFRLRYSDSGTLQFQNVVYQAVPAAAECATEEEVRAAVGGFMHSGAGSMTLLLDAELFQRLYTKGEMYRVMAELGVENFRMSGNSLNVCFISDLEPMKVPYARVAGVSEAGDRIALWREAQAEAFNLVFEPDVYQALSRDDYRLIAFLGGADDYSLSYSNAACTLMFSGVTYTDIPSAYCEGGEQIVSAIRAMGARDISAFQLMMDEATYQAVSADSFAPLNALQAEAGMSGGDLYYSSFAHLVQFENAVIQADVAPLASLAEVVAHVEECAARGDENISMLLTAEVYADLMEGMDSMFGGEAKFYDLVGNAGIEDAREFSFNRNMGAVNMIGVRYYAGTDILRALNAGKTDSLSNREMQALAAAQQMAQDCARDSQAATALAIHDALCAGIVYTDDEATDEDDCCIGALLNGQANCDGYADAMLLVGRLAGLNVRYQHGDSSRDGLAGLFSTHLWNLVELDGSWRMLDVTWDDNEDEIGYQWFCIGEDRAALSHVWNREMTMDLLDETPAEGRPVAEYFAAAADEIAAAAAGAQAAGETAFDIYIRGDSDLNMFDVRQALQQGVSGSFYCSWIDLLRCMHVQLAA